MIKKIRIALFCAGGMSTSLVGSKMQKVYDSAGKDVQVDAYDFGMIDEIGSNVDVIIIAPQIGWAYDQVVQQYPEKKVIKLTIQEFGSMDGQVIINRLKEEGIEL